MLPNTLCIARLEQGEKNRPVTVESSIDNNDNFFRVRDNETSALYTVHRSQLMQTNIPSRFKLSHFERVAPIIGAALKAYPDALIVDPQDLSVETYCRILREAREAKKRYGYTHPAIDEKLFSLYADELTTSMADGKIYYGTKAAIKGKRNVGQVISSSPSSPNNDPSVLFAGNGDALERLCWLMHNRCFTPAPNFIVHIPDMKTIESLESRYDVAFAAVEGQENKYQLI